MSNKTFLFKQSINKMLALIEQLPDGKIFMPNDIELTKLLSISRTTVRTCVDHLIKEGIIERQAANKAVLRSLQPSDYFEIDESKSSKDVEFEKYFLNLIHTGKLLPGDKFSELSLAKQSSCTTITVREFLIKFSNNGLIKKIPRGRWQMEEFDEEFALELVSFREMVEMKALSSLLKLPQEHDVWIELKQLREKHLQLKNNFDQDYLSFPDLDRSLHQVIQRATKNRFTQQFFDLVSFVCHYHYQWDKDGKKERFSIALNEHIDLLNNLLNQDISGSVLSLEAHLRTAKTTLLRCVHGLES